MKTIVVSAVNFTEGGPLTILKQCLSCFSHYVKTTNEYKVTAIVYDKSLCEYDNIDYIEYKKAKRSWLNRVKAEYYDFYKLSKEIKPYLWLSLHDITPRVVAEKRVVYCHNPTPFKKIEFKDLYYSYKVFLFSIFYRFLYAINIRKNNYIIVQQNWLRNEFVELFSLKEDHVIVAYPDLIKKQEILPQVQVESQCKMFFFPSFARPFKNFEIICKASELLKKRGITNYEIVLTIDGSENKYSQTIIRQYGADKNIQFIGCISHENVLLYYWHVLITRFLDRHGLCSVTATKNEIQHDYNFR
jgi:hypothetical protein